MNFQVVAPQAALKKYVQHFWMLEHQADDMSYIGITPVLFARICRFQTALTLLRQGRFHSLTDIAYTLDYYDQTHFIHDFKLFSGASPRIYLRKTIEHMPGFPEWQS